MSSILSATIVRNGKKTSGKSEKNLREYTITIEVVCSDAAYDHNALLAYGSPIPAPATGTGGSITLPTQNVSTYPTDAGALLVNYDLTQHENVYRIVYFYTSNPPISQLRNPDPTQRLPIYSVSQNKQQEAFIVDQDGVAVINSADDAYENPPSLPKSRSVITIHKNYTPSVFGLTETQLYIDSINSNGWLPSNQSGTPMSFIPYSCYMDNVTLNQREENAIVYHEVEFKFIYDPNLFYPYQILDCGYNAYISGTKTQLGDGRGNPFQKPQLLDGFGGTASVISGTSMPVYNDYNAFKQVDWSDIP